MFTEKALLEVEGLDISLFYQDAVDPGDMRIGFLDSLPGCCIEKDNLAGVDFFVFVDLPEDGGARPVFGGSYEIG